MEKYLFKVNGKNLETVNGIITGKEILEIAELLPVEDFELLIKVNETTFEPIELNEEVNLKEEGVEDFLAKPYRELVIKVDDEPVEVKDCILTPNEILTESGKDPDGHYLKQIIGHKEISYKNDRLHKVAIKNGLRFSTCKLEPATVS